MDKVASPTLLDSLELDLPNVELPDSERGHDLPQTPMLPEADLYNYVRSGPQGAHEHIAIGN